MRQRSFEALAEAADIERTIAGRTVCSMLLETVRERSGGIALRRRDGERFVELTWAEVGVQVARLTRGLRDAGVRPGDRVLLMLRNRPEFHITDLAVLFAGATPVSIYNSSSAEQVAFLAASCGATTAVVDDAGFHAKLEGLGLREVVVDGAPGSATRWWDLLGEPDDLHAAAASITPDQLATIIYTSGTTGPPKGVMITHHNVAFAVESQLRALPFEPYGFRVLSYLPMAHIAERMVSHYEAVAAGYQITSCPALGQLAGYLPQVNPQLFFGVPRVWEKIHSGIRAAAPAVVGELIAEAFPLRRRSLSPAEADRLAEIDVELQPWRAVVGLDDCPIPVTSAAPISPSLIEWFVGLGVPLTEVYGMSELCGPVTWDLEDAKVGTVGRALPGCELRIAADGEVLARGGLVFAGYLDDPVKTAEAVDADGWLHTGDIGTLDADGYLKIVDRKKELLITAGGENISPANLEAALKTIAFVDQACVVGDRKPFIAALLTLNRELPAPDEATLAAAIREAMDGFNHAEQVKRFLVLPGEWAPDSDELTPTAKLKRHAVEKKYAREIESLYAGGGVDTGL